MEETRHEWYEYAVVGAGPAGLQMGYFLQKASRRYVVLEARPLAASFFQSMPRNRRLISLNKRFNMFAEDEFNLRHDWNSLLSDDANLRFPRYSSDLYPKADDIVRYMNDFATGQKLNIRYNTAIKQIDKTADGSEFILSANDGSVIRVRTLLMASGAVVEHLPQKIEGIELAETYGKHAEDKALYNNKRVCIIGGGNSAFETADQLSGNAAIIHLVIGSELKLAWNTHSVANVRSVNSSIIDMVRMRSMHSLFGSTVTKIERLPSGCLLLHFSDRDVHADPPFTYKFAVEYDHVITCCGFKYIDGQLFSDRARPAVTSDGRYPLLNSSWETDVPNLFFVGTASGGGANKKSSSGFIHGFRYNVRTLFKILQERFHGIPLTKLSFGKDLEAITAKIIERASVSDGLYQMYSYLCDVVVANDNGTEYFPELPVRYVLERKDFIVNEHMFLFWLDYGFHRFNNEATDDVHAPNLLQTECIPFLHTVVTYYRYGTKVADCHLHGSLVLRLDKISASTFPQWPHNANENYLMEFFNRHLHWTEKQFDLAPFPAQLLAKIFKPLSESEKKRIPTD